jgi:hypothetical protein
MGAFLLRLKVNTRSSSPSHHEELQVASTSGRDDYSISSTSLTCDLSQGNDMVSEEIICEQTLGSCGSSVGEARN